MEEYEIDDNNPASWKNYPRPYYPSAFDEMLEKACGKNPFGMPNVRVVWGSERMDDVYVRAQLKYRDRIVRDLKGYSYLDPKTNKKCFVKRHDEVPKEVLLATPVFEDTEIGVPRWHVEYWASAEELVLRGKFDRQYDPNPENLHDTINPLIRELPSTGIYKDWFCIERKNGKFRNLDKEVVDEIIAMWNYNMTKSNAEKLADIACDDERKNRNKLRRIAEIWEIDMDKETEDAIIEGVIPRYGDMVLDRLLTNER